MRSACPADDRCSMLGGVKCFTVTGSKYGMLQPYDLLPFSYYIFLPPQHRKSSCHYVKHFYLIILTHAKLVFRTFFIYYTSLLKYIRSKIFKRLLFKPGNYQSCRMSRLRLLVALHFLLNSIFSLLPVKSSFSWRRVMNWDENSKYCK